MAKKVNIKWNIKAFEQIRRTAPVSRLVRSHAERIAANAGDGYEAEVGHGKTRTRGSVVAVTNKARIDNARNNTLLRAAKNSGK